jgi:hypothetical protein
MNKLWETQWSFLGLIRKQKNTGDSYISAKKEYRITILFIPVFYWLN